MFSNIPVDLNAQIHQWIVSGEFLEWRTRTARRERTLMDNAGREMAHCTFPGCAKLYLVHKNKRTTYCNFHAHRGNRQRVNAPEN